MSHFTEQFLKRFWSKIQKPEDPDACWVWLAGTNDSGYGQIRADGRKGRLLRAHRVTYELEFGVDPGDLFVLHKCDNPPCVNPRHLFLGTSLDNTLDRENKGRGNHPRGENTGRWKLTDFQVSEIRRLYAQGGITHRALGSMFGVDHSQVSDIINLKSRRRPT